MKIMKTSVRKFKAFIDDDEFWPKGAHYEYGSFTVNGISVDEDNSLFDDDDAVIEIKEGAVIIPAVDEKYKTCTLDHFFRKWRKSHVD